MAKVEKVKTTIRVRKDIWDELRIRAIREGNSAEYLVQVALAQFLGFNKNAVLEVVFDKTKKAKKGGK